MLHFFTFSVRGGPTPAAACVWNIYDPRIGRAVFGGEASRRSSNHYYLATILFFLLFDSDTDRKYPTLPDALTGAVHTRTVPEHVRASAACLCMSRRPSSVIISKNRESRASGCVYSMCAALKACAGASLRCWARPARSPPPHRVPRRPRSGGPPAGRSGSARR